MPTAPTLQAWWLEPLPKDSAEHAVLNSGLSDAAAKARFSRYGPNLLRKQQAEPLIRQYLARFKNPLVLILLGAGAVSALSEQIADFLIISVMVLLSVTLDFFQEYRANSAAEKLRESVSGKILVMRGGRPVEILVSQVVPGDIALLSAGDLIPADGRVLDAQDFFVKQALLTGESYPVEKHAGTLPATATDLQEATNAVFMGTSVISGSARMLNGIRNFMLIIGPISSLFDFLTFYIMLVVLQANEALFPDRLVRRIALHPGIGDLHHQNAGQSAETCSTSCRFSIFSSLNWPNRFFIDGPQLPDLPLKFPSVSIFEAGLRRRECASICLVGVYAFCTRIVLFIFKNGKEYRHDKERFHSPGRHCDVHGCIHFHHRPCNCTVAGEQ